MKTWKRGRKPATPEQLKIAKNIQKIRVKIANTVARDNTIDRKCCICGVENSPIFHNKIDPYLITFLCKDCRKDEKNIEQAEKTRFDLRKHKEKILEERDTNYYLDTRKFTKEEVRDIIENYDKDNNMMTFGEYVEKYGLSRHQFSQLQERYIEYFPDKQYVIDAIHNRSKAIQRNKLSMAANDRNLQLKNK